MMAGGHHRILRIAVWIARAIGWVLLLVAILGITQAAFLPTMLGRLRLLPSIGLALMAVVWIAGLELFLHFFDRYLSRN
jgi:ABC-type methionine transport system permease subunit